MLRIMQTYYTKISWGLMAQIRVNYNRANLTLNCVYKRIALIIAGPLNENKKGTTKRLFQKICQLFKKIFRLLFHP